MLCRGRNMHGKSICGFCSLKVLQEIWGSISEVVKKKKAADEITKLNYRSGCYSQAVTYLQKNPQAPKYEHNPSTYLVLLKEPLVTFHISGRAKEGFV